jgi:hypothetical protein
MCKTSTKIQSERDYGCRKTSKDMNISVIKICSRNKSKDLYRGAKEEEAEALKTS